jgi:hypothetical protein
VRLRIVVPVVNVTREVSDDRAAHRTRLRAAALLVLWVRRPPVSPATGAPPTAAAAAAVRSFRSGTALRVGVVLARGAALLVLALLVGRPLASLVLLLTGT